MDKRQICIKFAREVSAILKIAAPAIRFVPVKQLRTSTQIAALTPDGILIRNDIGVTPELFFAIAHELRHAYQLENDRSLHDYRTSDQLDIDEYNAQPLEVDANAFAAGVMAEFFGISPQFLHMPESIRQLIYVRKRQIQKELRKPSFHSILLFAERQNRLFESTMARSGRAVVQRKKSLGSPRAGCRMCAIWPRTANGSRSKISSIVLSRCIRRIWI